jgi:NDP-4-keto-2,6-dideoxyhexose 3-C-methyltransferase
MSLTVEVEKCFICSGEDLVEILDLGNQPMSGIFPLETEENPVSSPLILMQCKSISFKAETCGNIQLKHKANFSNMYGLNYGYNSSLSPLMLEHLGKIAENARKHIAIKETDFILDIGCNDGSFLNLFKAQTKNLVGVDPSSAKFEDITPVEANIFVDYFPSTKIFEFMDGRKFKMISSIAMFYDLDKPFEFMQALHDSLEDNGLWIVELSEFGEFLKNLSFDQICHEHLLYIDANLLINMSSKIGFELLEVTFSEINGGSACYYFRKCKPNTEVTCYSSATSKQIDKLKFRVEQNKSEVMNYLKMLNQQGKSVFGYGASTKGNVLANFYGLDKGLMQRVSDTNPFKWGRVTPGPRIPIISHEEMRNSPPDYLFVFIWHLRSEVLKNEKHFIENGGKLIIPLPRLHVIDRDNYELYVNRDLNDLAFDISNVDLTI